MNGNLITAAGEALILGKQRCFMGKYHRSIRFPWETINMKTDFYRGTYEICFTLSTLRITEPDSGKRDILFGSEGTEPWEDHAISLELIGENGNQVLYQEWLSPDDFNEAAKCTRTLNCSLESVPEVYFAVETGNHISVTIEEISWQRIS